MPVIVNDIAQLKEAIAISSQALAEIKETTDKLRVAYARAVLQKSFPEHTLAVFARAWDQNEPKLIQLLGNRDQTIDIDLQDSGVFDKLTIEQGGAISRAEMEIRLIGSDEELWKHLDAPDENEDEDTAWYEFDLALTWGENETE